MVEKINWIVITEGNRTIFLQYVLLKFIIANPNKQNYQTAKQPHLVRHMTCF